MKTFTTVLALLILVAGVSADEVAKPGQVKVSAVQLLGYDKTDLPRPGYDPSQDVVPYIEKAAKEGSQLVVFPEYLLGRISVPGEQTERIGRAAAAGRIYVIVGCWEVFADGTYVNTALLFDRSGKIAVKYNKVHAAVDQFEGLPTWSKPPSDKDMEWFLKNDPEWKMKRGGDFPVFDLDFGRVGILTCYDGWFPETFRILSLKGAEVLVWVNGRRGPVEDFIVKSAMYQNEVAMVVTNQSYGSGTMIAQWPAQIITACNEPKEQFISATLDLEQVRKARRNSRNLQQRRPELYAQLVRPIDSAMYTAAADRAAERRTVANEAERDYWLAVMNSHGYTVEEMSSVLGLTVEETQRLTEESRQRTLPSQFSDGIGQGAPFLLPYPGGRHPRIGFLDGAVDPQRETKVSAFAPWKDGGYIVVDLPEAVWHTVDGRRELLYLAHTHVPTIWDKAGVKLPKLEWTRDKDGSLSLTREFPNRVKMFSRATMKTGGIRLEFGVVNNSDAPLTGLQVQMCGMLKGLNGFDQQTNANKLFASPFAACQSTDGKRWVILGFNKCVRAWGNPPCPCLHADPQVPDCPPGETRSVFGWISFFEGESIQKELERLKRIAFQDR